MFQRAACIERISSQGDRFNHDFRFPQAVAFGVAYRLTPRLTIAGRARWTDSRKFEKAVVRFRRHPAPGHDRSGSSSVNVAVTYPVGAGR